MTPTPDPAAVRAACERVRDALDCTSIDLDNMPVACVADLVTIGRAYLAAHPPADARPAAGERVIVQHMNGFEVREHRLEKPGTIEGYYVGFAREPADADLLAHGRCRVAELEAALGDALVVLAALVITDREKPYVEFGPDLRRELIAAHDIALRTLAEGRP